MTREIDADYSQSFLLPPNLEDWVGADHPVRFIRDFIDSQDMAALGLKSSSKAGPGNPHYAPSLLLKIWLYGWLERIRTSRPLERACRQHLALMWLCGLETPDHNTLWRFWRSNKQVMHGLFRRSVEVAVEMGLVSMAIHAVDGTKIQAASSARRAWHGEDLQRLLERLEAQIEDMEKQLEEEGSSKDPGYTLGPQLSDAHRRRAAIEQALAKLAEADRKHMQPDEPQVKMIAAPGREIGWNYNAQAVAEQSHQIIVAQDLVTDPNDLHQLTPMLDEAKKNLGSAADVTLADAGYASQQQLGLAAERAMNVLVNLPQQNAVSDKPLHSHNFRYDEQKDVCICPAFGNELAYAATRKARPGHLQSRIYRCSAAGCPLASQCTSNPRGREIEITQQRRAVMDQLERQRCPKTRGLMRRRQAIIEPVFGWIKQTLGFRRFTVKGLLNTQAQWALACLIHNLSKLISHWQKSQTPSTRPTILAPA